MLIRKKLVNSILFFLLSAFLIACKDKSASKNAESDLKDSLALAQNDTAIVVNYNSEIANDKIILKFQPEIGKTYYIENNSNYTSFQSMDTMKMKATSVKFGKVKLQVLGLENDQYKITFTLTDARKSIKDDSSSIEYTYGKALTDPIADVDRQIEDCMVNTPLTLFITTKGEGTDIQGYENIIKKVKAIVGADVPDEYIANSIGTPTDNLENYFVFYPDTAVKIGDTWNITTNSNLQGLPITLTNTYTLADRKDGIAFINFNTVVKIDKKQIPEDVVAQMANMQFSAFVKGTGQVDDKTGFPIIMRISQSMEMKDSFEGHSTVSKQSSSSVIRRME